MLSEIRQIIFANEDLVRALVNIRKRTGKPLPTGTVRKVETNLNRGDISVMLDIEMMPDGRVAHYKFDKDNLISAMISYCIDTAVPIPVKANKSVHMVGESVALVLTLNLSYQKLENI